MSSTRYTLKELKGYTKDAYCPTCKMQGCPKLGNGFNPRQRIVESFVSVGKDHTSMQTDLLCELHGAVTHSTCI